ncbi:MAG: FecR domain-containing protein, partial [Gammaproteobacteria bacterium]|nr:FecR domain-containing protein [Gammaproteobacteria bacterium]
MPAWVQRGGTRLPVAPGMALEAGDILRTGPNARLLVQLAEGSLVKLGADAELRLQALKPASTGGLFEGLLDVVKGAFRFTTTLLSRNHRRKLDVRIANVTAGIRGTDVWGKAASDKDIVCLIEGEVSVTRGSEPTITMSDPLSFYVAPHGQAPLPVRPVDPEQLQRWALETDIAEDGPALVENGAWRVYVESLSSS